MKYYSELTPERALVMFKAYLYSFEGMTEERVNRYINQIKKTSGRTASGQDCGTEKTI
ncbi:hypothetical protein [Erysipelothrix rhusiopathiae]|uniref:hypothetical protein n=1 Tax=Erysipelothrix rhusiopathiae TaxID=1648 RepID=UPI00130EF9B5|nr:hypothetical protein [Erysipelothrix rhusiopathiae]